MMTRLGGPLLGLVLLLLSSFLDCALADGIVATDGPGSFLVSLIILVVIVFVVLTIGLAIWYKIRQNKYVAGAAHTIGEVSSSAASAASSAASSARSALPSGQSVRDAAGNAATSIGSGVSSLAHGTVNLAKGAVNMVSDAATSDVAKSTKDGIVHGAQKAGSAVKDGAHAAAGALSGAASGAVEGAKK